MQYIRLLGSVGSRPSTPSWGLIFCQHAGHHLQLQHILFQCFTFEWKYSHGFEMRTGALTVLLVNIINIAPIREDNDLTKCEARMHDGMPQKGIHTRFCVVSFVYGPHNITRAFARARPGLQIMLNGVDCLLRNQQFITRARSPFNYMACAYTQKCRTSLIQ